MEDTATFYVSDMDGTLLGTDSRVSAESARIISGLSRAGALVTVATARTPATVVPLLEGTRMRPDAIVMTGAATWNWGEGRFAEAHFISADHMERVLGLCAERGVFPFCYACGPTGVCWTSTTGRRGSPRPSAVSTTSAKGWL